MTDPRSQEIANVIFGGPENRPTWYTFLVAKRVENSSAVLGSCPVYSGPSFFSNIEDTWLLVEYMVRRKGYAFFLSLIDHEYVASFTNADYPAESTEARSSNVSEAICTSALKAVRHKTSDKECDKVD